LSATARLPSNTPTRPSSQSDKQSDARTPLRVTRSYGAPTMAARPTNVKYEGAVPCVGERTRELSDQERRVLARLQGSLLPHRSCGRLVDNAQKSHSTNPRFQPLTPASWKTDHGYSICRARGTSPAERRTSSRACCARGRRFFRISFEMASAGAIFGQRWERNSQPGEFHPS